jgi:hypothetical protein
MTDSAITGRFGVEIELNSLDFRDFVKNPLANGERPVGMDRIAEVVSGLGFNCEIQDWQYNHNPSFWTCKPDSSCGLELCSPVLDGSSKDQLFLVMDALSADDSILVDERCAFHVHLELSSMELKDSFAAILAWWIKCEHVFVDFASPLRKNNFYCKPIGITDTFAPDETVCAKTIFRKLGYKHFSANAFHFFSRRRPSLEFRIAEGTKDSLFADRWIKTLLRFAESAASRGMPSDYLWIPPEKVFQFMNLDSDLESWFVSRLLSNCQSGSSECFSPRNRFHASQSYAFLSRSISK